MREDPPISSNILRLATPEDAGAIAGIYAPYVETTTISFETTPPTAGEMAERMTAGGGAYPWLVWQQDGAVAGYAYAGRYGARPGYNWAAESSVYIRQGARGGGGGRALYTALINLLKMQGVRTLVAVVASPNPESEGFHLRLGFERQGQIKNVGYKLGRPMDVAHYVRPLLPVCENPPIIRRFDNLPADEVRAVLRRCAEEVFADSNQELG